MRLILLILISLALPLSATQLSAAQLSAAQLSAAQLSASQSARDADYGAGPLETIEILSDSKTHPFQVEVAVTSAQQRRGLMFRERLAPDGGMLFAFGRAGLIHMWMKNTLLSLDMIFLDGAGRIVAIHERAVPGSTEIISSNVEARAVLEVLAGTVERLGLRVGDRASHRIFSEKK